ncbi:hypothetical protein [Actinoallomurus sp. NPDC050550]|uniref:hypothetical protein n=1 Tax=Actinoallomurus sp. NPDC050550 TaxID=3154937 RepID=UPI0033D109C8
MTAQERIQNLWQAHRDLPWNGQSLPRHVPLLEEGISLADSIGDLRHSFRFRIQLAAVLGNLHLVERALVPLSWCLATFDSKGSELPAHYGDRLLEVAMTILQKMPHLPEISRIDIDRLLDDLTQRHRRAGYPPRGMLERGQYVLMCVGDLDRAAGMFAAWRSLPRDKEVMNSNRSCLYDCDTCEAAGVMEWLLAIGNDEEALAAAQPVLDGTASAFDSSCDGMKEWILAHALAPLLRQGRAEEAGVQHRRGLRLVTGDPSALDELAPHLTFLAATGQAVQALPLLERHLALAGERTDHLRYELDTAVWLVVEALAGQGTAKITLRLPEWHHAHEPSGRYEAIALADRLAVPLRTLAARYDTRNGNTFVSAQLERQRALLDLDRA